MLEHALNGRSRGTSLASGYNLSVPTAVSAAKQSGSQSVQPAAADNHAPGKQSTLNPATGSYFPQAMVAATPEVPSSTQGLMNETAN